MFLRDLGIDIYGNANQQIPNSKEPIVGSVVILKGGKLGHVALVLEVRDDSIVIVESNYKPCQITYRVIPKSSSIIKGYLI